MGREKTKKKRIPIESFFSMLRMIHFKLTRLQISGVDGKHWKKQWQLTGRKKERWIHFCFPFSNFKYVLSVLNLGLSNFQFSALFILQFCTHL